MKGYLGAVAVSPSTNFIEDTSAIAPILGLAAIMGLPGAMQSFNITEVITPAGQQLIDQLAQSGGCSAVADALIPSVLVLQDNWRQNPIVQSY